MNGNPHSAIVENPKASDSLGRMCKSMSPRHNKNMPRPGDKVHIPLEFDEAVRGLLKVKPTKDMPRPGATGKKAATKPKKRTKKNV